MRPLQNLMLSTRAPQRSYYWRHGWYEVCRFFFFLLLSDCLKNCQLLMWVEFRSPRYHISAVSQFPWTQNHYLLTVSFNCWVQYTGNIVVALFRSKSKQKKKLTLPLYLISVLTHGMKIIVITTWSKLLHLYLPLYLQSFRFCPWPLVEGSYSIWNKR